MCFYSTEASESVPVWKFLQVIPHDAKEVFPVSELCARQELETGGLADSEKFSM